MTWGLVEGRVREGRQSGFPQGENFLKQGPKQGLLVHSEQIVKDGSGHWISSLCTVLKSKHQSLI